VKRRRRLRAGVRAVAIVAIVVGSGAAIYAERSVIYSGLASFLRSEAGWVIAALAAECVSMAGLARLQQIMVRAAGTSLALDSLMAIAYSSNALSTGVPVAGSGLAVAYSQRQYHARGADRATVTLALGVAGVISSVAFAVIVGVGAVVSGNPAAAVAGLVTSLCGAVAAILLVVALHSPRGRARLRRPTVRVLRLSKRLIRRPSGDPVQAADGALRRLGAFNLSLPGIVSAFASAMVNWLADVLCLAASIAAIGVTVPWSKLLLVWSAGSAAATFAPTPFGLGIVDIALITALHASGVASGEAVGAVLLYRIISTKILMTLLWRGYRRLRDRRRPATRSR
jgi:putative heme transporter